MPAGTHLTWVDIKDFAPGLWQANDWLMPANGWQTFEDAYPQEGGGVRAFYKASSISVSGITSATKERVIGLHARGGIPARSGSPTELVDRYLATYFFDSGAVSGSQAQPRLYRMDGTNSETTWTEIKKAASARFAFSSSNNNSPRKASFKFFKNLTGSPDDQWMILILRYVGTDIGVWRLNYNDLSSAQVATAITWSISGTVKPDGPVTVHQSRLVVGGGDGGIQDTLYFSEPGQAGTNTSTDFLEVDPSQDLPGIIALSPSPPSDLFVFREGAPPVLIQGDIKNQTSQVMGEGIIGYTGEQDITRTPMGYAFISPSGLIYFTDGVTYTPLSQQLKGIPQSSEVVSVGDLNYIEDFIFAPMGYVYHLPTKSWFTQTQMAGRFHNVERATKQIWGPVAEGVSFSLVKLNPQNVAGASRVSTYHLKSAPIHATDGRRIGMREIQVYVNAHDTGATITITVNGTANTITMTASGKQQLSFLFNEKNEVLDVDIVATAGSASNEAPTIEGLRLGFMPGTNLAPSE